jgi:hypothetical protein
MGDILRLAFSNAIRVRSLRRQRDAWMYAALAAAGTLCLMILHSRG